MSRRDAPNVLLIVIDSARADRFGCYGYPRVTTPAIDALANEALVHERMIATAPWTLPSHASLFTGLYTREHGADYPSLRASSGLLTVDRLLQSHGYETVFISNNPIVAKRMGIIDDSSRVVMRQDFNPDVRRRWVRRLKKLTGHADRGSGATNRAVRRLLGRRTAPLFLFINYMECHWRYVAPRSFERRFVRQRFSSLHSAWYRMRTTRRYSWENARMANPEEAALLSDLYDAALACVDDRIGDLLAALDHHRLRDDTIVIITADHGENLGDHGLSGHGMSLYQTLLRVPFIARIPGLGALRGGELAQLTDVFAGLCRLLDIPVPDHLQGRPFAGDPFLPMARHPGRDFAFAEYQQPDGGVMVRRLRRTGFVPPPSAMMVRDERYSLIVEPSSGAEALFDLQEDQEERNNRLEALRPQRERLYAALEQWRSVFQPVGTITPYTPEEEQALQARLRDLGYA